MNMLPAFLNRLITFLLLLQCAGAQAAITGPQTAQLLNTRYQDTTTSCAASKPAWYCNGVLLRAEAPVSGQPFWKLDSDAQALGAQGFAYLRRDLGIRTLGAPHGVIFSDLFTAVGDGKALEVLCAYPLTQPLDASRADHGCGLPAISQSSAADVSSCAAAGVTDSASWLAHFQQSGSQPVRQCSFSSLDAAQFDASLKAHKGLDSDGAAKANRLQVKTWDETRPASLPVQALFYDRKQNGSLLAAQIDQRDYFNATGQWLPVLRLDFDNDTEKVFGFNLQDQMYVGYQVAANMNRRYADPRTECMNQQAAYFCNGVLIRGAAATTTFHAWNPSPNSEGRNGVSFSYLRADVGTTKLAGTQGFTMKESFAPAKHPLTLRCSYPVNAKTSSIPDSCRASCEQQGITSVETWREIHGTSPADSCAFTSNPAQFQLSVLVRSALTPAARAGWNELIVAAWPQDIPSQIPLEAFFYTAANTLPQAQFIQRDYFNVTGAFLPVVRMTLTQAQPFDYTPHDQLAPGTATLGNVMSQEQGADIWPPENDVQDPNKKSSAP